MGAPTTNLSLPRDTIGLNPFKRSFREAMAILDDAVGAILEGSETKDFASLADGAQTTEDVTVTGAALGDYVVAVSLGVSAAGLEVSGYVSATDTVTVLLRNGTGAPVDLASTTIRALVRKA